MTGREVVTISPGPGGWPGDAALYWNAGRGSVARARGYSMVDVATDAIARLAWRVQRFAHHPLTMADVEKIHALIESMIDAGPSLPGLWVAERYAVDALLAAWRKGYAVRSVYHGKDYAPPVAE